MGPRGEEQAYKGRYPPAITGSTGVLFQILEHPTSPVPVSPKKSKNTDRIPVDVPVIRTKLGLRLEFTGLVGGVPGGNATDESRSKTM